MKALRTLLPLFVTCTLLMVSGCGSKSGNALTPQDKQLGLLVKTWKLGSVTYNSIDSSSHWTNFQLTISGKQGQPSPYNYSCTGRPFISVWPASGTWKFDETSATTIASKVIRIEDGLQMTYSIDPSSTQLTLSFNYTSSTYYTRTGNLGGSWQFVLVPK